MMGRLIRLLALAAVLLGVASLGVTAAVQQSYGARAVASAADLPRTETGRIAIVFGAGLWATGAPTPILYDRVATAADLYKRGNVRRLLMTGDDSTQGHDEPGAMIQSALSLGVPRAALVGDGAGLRTYDSCVRARDVYGISRAIIVTQRFHMARALFTCAQLGIDVIGVDADRRDYAPASYTWWMLREVPSTLLAYLDVTLLRPAVTMSPRQPIQ